MKENEIFEKCQFYELANGNVSICAYIDKNWDKSFVLILVGAEMFLISGKTLKKTVIANILTNEIFIDDIYVKKISSVNAKMELKTAVLNRLRKDENEK